MKRIGRFLTFQADPFRTHYTIPEVRQGLAIQLPGESLFASTGRATRNLRGIPPAEVEFRQRQKSKCPMCPLTLLVGDVRTVARSDGMTVLYHVHKQDGSIRRVCRKEV